MNVKQRILSMLISVSMLLSCGSVLAMPEEDPAEPLEMAELTGAGQGEAELAEAGDNLALNKAVTSSASLSPYSGYGFEKMVDGSSSTRLALADGNTTDGWVEIDLGGQMAFNKITMTEYQQRMVKWRFQYSSDRASWSDAGEQQSQTGAVAPDATTENVHPDVVFAPVKARYVRVYFDEHYTTNGTSYYGISIFEMGVYNTQTDEEKADHDLAALNLDGLGEVTEDFTLPTLGAVNDCELSWVSDSAAIVISGGSASVTRQAADTPVKLTATAKSGAVEKTKEFHVTVKGHGGQTDPNAALVAYDASAASGQPGYIDAAKFSSYGITINTTNAYGLAMEDVAGGYPTFNRKGIRYSIRQGLGKELKELKGFDFTANTVNSPAALSNLQNGYVFEQELASYTLTVDNEDPGVWQYILWGKNQSGQESPIATLQMSLANAVTAQDGIYYGTAAMKSPRSKQISVSMKAEADTYKSTALYYLRVYVDLKNQTYTAWLVRRANRTTPYAETEPEKADLLIRDEPFETVGIQQLTGMRMKCANLFSGVSYITKLQVSEMRDAEVAAEAKKALEFADIQGENLSASDVKTSLSLPAVYQNASVNWSASPTGVINTATGEVIRQKQDTPVTLTAAITRGTGGSESKEFTVTVKAAEAVVETDEEKVDADLAALALGFTEAAEDFTLPTAGTVKGCEISWSSNSAAIVISGGSASVTRQATDTQVKLTATVKSGAVSKTKEFTVTVKAKETEAPPTAAVECYTNLALKKTVTGSAEAFSDTYTYSKAVDGDSKTRLALKDWTDLSGAWIQIDLGKIYKFNQLKLIEFRKRLKQFKLEYSADGESWNEINTYQLEANNEEVDPYTHEPYQFDTVEGRYLRLNILENVKIDGSHYLGVSLYEIGVYYTGEHLLYYDPNAAAGGEGYIDGARLAEHGITVNLSDSYAPLLANVNTKIASMAGKKGLMISPRDKKDSVMRQAGKLVFADDKIIQPAKINNMEDGYVFEQEFLSYTRPSVDGDAIWQYRLMGADGEGGETAIAALQTCLTMTDGAIPAPVSGISYGTASMAGAADSTSLPFPAAVDKAASWAPHVSFLRMYVDLKRQTYTAWLVTRADVNTPYTEKEPEKAQLLVRDEPFDKTVTEITGLQVWTQDTQGDQTYFTRLRIDPMDGGQVVESAKKALDASDLLGDNASADAVTGALELPEVYQNADVRWSMEPAGIIGEDGGILTTPAKDTRVTLTARLSRGEAAAAKELKVTVTTEAAAETDSHKVEVEKAALSLGDTSAVTGNLTLPVIGPKRGCTIKWTSSNESVIEENGTVHRTPRGDTVTLTAEISFGTAKDTKEFEVKVLGTAESKNIQGVPDSYFQGGVFYKTGQVSFADLFEGDGSNGTNGTIPYEKEGKTEGLKAEKLADGIKFSKAGPEGANPGRAKAMLDVTYPLPEMTDPGAPYYVELNVQMNAGGAVDFDFGQNEGMDGELAGGKGVASVRKLDDYTGSDATAGPIEGPAAYAYQTEGMTQCQADYTASENAAIGLYVIPEMHEVVFYKNGKPVDSQIYRYTDAESAFETIHIAWYQNIRWYNIPAADYLTIKNVQVYQGDPMSDEQRVALDKEWLEFSAISDGNPEQLSKDLTLCWSGKYGSVITWESSNPAVIDPKTGALHQGDRDETVVLTARLTRGTETDQKSFTVHVPRNRLTGAKVTIENTASIESVKNLTDNLFDTYIETLDAGVRPRIVLDMGREEKLSEITVYEGMTGGGYAIQGGILEASSDNSHWTQVAEFSEIGEKKTLAFLPIKAQYVRFTVTRMDSAKTVRLYEIEAQMAPPDDSVTGADLRDLIAFDTYNVKESAVFKTTGEFGSTISWSCDHPELVDETGAVTRPEENQPVVITATLTYGTSTRTGTYRHQILGTGGGNTSGGSSGGGRGSGGGGGSPSGGGGLVNVTGGPTATPQPGEDEAIFRDVRTDSWAYPYIKTLYEKRILTGSGDGNFEPERPILREEYLKLLLLAMDVQADGQTEAVFTDVSQDDWFCGYVNAAYRLGLVQGMPDGSFGAGQEITRQDLAVLTKRMADLKGIALSQKQEADLKDLDQVSGYAQESVLALAGAAILSGDENQLFHPQASALREQAAKIICLLMEQ